MARGRPDYTMFEFGSETVATEDSIIRHTASQISGGGDVAFLFLQVPLGHAMELNHIYACNNTSATPRITASISHAPANFRIKTELNIAADEPLIWTGKIWMAEEDFIMIYFAGTAVADSLTAVAFGKDVIRR